MDVQQRPKVNWRIILFRGAIVLALLVIATLLSIVFFLPTSADKAAEVRMIGKWGIYISQSNIALPPDRIIEFLAHGQTADYSPSLELWGRSDDSGREFSWHIRRGIFIVTMSDPGKLGRRLVDQSPITWIDDDNFVLTMTGPDGQPIPVRYRRLGADELKKLQATSPQSK